MTFLYREQGKPSSCLALLLEAAGKLKDFLAAWQNYIRANTLSNTLQPWNPAQWTNLAADTSTLALVKPPIEGQDKCVVFTCQLAQSPGDVLMDLCNCLECKDTDVERIANNQAQQDLYTHFLGQWRYYADFATDFFERIVATTMHHNTAETYPLCE